MMVFSNSLCSGNAKTCIVMASLLVSVLDTVHRNQNSYSGIHRAGQDCLADIGESAHGFSDPL